MTRMLSAALLGIAGLALTACMSGPPPAVYILGTMPAAAPGNAIQAGLPVVELKSVRVPDYLDTTDLVLYRNGQVTFSQTGRWGERLSVGVTRTLAAGLASRLPGMRVTTAQPVERPARQILVDLESFEARADGRMVLVALWSIIDGAARRTLTAERSTVVVPVEGSGDAAVTAAMTRCIDDLAAQVAVGLGRVTQAQKINPE
ncbi:MAG: PqiC family protein [Magnetospirillum sp.]|nr:PqiC family protein [Magnetospirillum sp.]